MPLLRDVGSETRPSLYVHGRLVKGLGFSLFRGYSRRPNPLKGLILGTAGHLKHVGFRVGGGTGTGSCPGKCSGFCLEVHGYLCVGLEQG